MVQAHITSEALVAAAAGARSRATMRVALVAMPWAAASRPSIQLGLLRAICEGKGMHADSCHLNLDLAARLGPAVYRSLCEHRGRLTGEWLFSVAAFGADADADDEH